MALCESGTVVGSVSGGCIEDDLIYRYSHANTGHGVTHDIPKGPPERLVYGVSARDFADAGFAGHHQRKTRLTNRHTRNFAID